MWGVVKKPDKFQKRGRLKIGKNIFDCRHLKVPEDTACLPVAIK